MCLNASSCTSWRVSMKRIGRHALQFVAEMIADGGLQNFVHQIHHRPDHGNHARRVRVRHVDLHLQVDRENEAFVALRDDLLQLRVEIVRLRYLIGPIQSQEWRSEQFPPGSSAG